MDFLCILEKVWLGKKLVSLFSPVVVFLAKDAAHLRRAGDVLREVTMILLSRVGLLSGGRLSNCSTDLVPLATYFATL